MKRVLFFMCCLAISLHIFSQEQLSKELFPTLAGLEITKCSVFSVTENNSEEDKIEYKSFLSAPKEEITIDDKKYLKWGSYLLREENGKILVYSEKQKKDFVLYDFTLEIGDTITTLNFDVYSDTISVVDYPVYLDPDEKPTFDIDTLIVTEISTIVLLDGNEYKKWKLSNGWSYVEKVGIFVGDFFALITHTGPLPTDIYLGSHIACISQNGQLLYKISKEEMKRLHLEEHDCKCLNKGASAIYYKPMVVEGYNWNVVNRNAQLDGSNSVNYKTIKQKFEGDSIINDVTYKKLWQSTDDELADYELIGLIREDAETEKVWVYVGDKEYLVYDFACSVGDKVTTLKSLQSAKNQIEEMRGGIHIANEDEKNIRGVLKYLGTRGIENPSDEQISKIAETLSLNEEYVKELIAMNNNAVSISADTYNENGEVISIFDMMPCSYSADSGVYEKESVEEMLVKIENCFEECQERQKPIISALLTRLICEVIVQCEINIRNFKFVDVEIVTAYIKTGTTPTQRDLAARFDKNEASISRTMKGFVDKLKEIIR